MISYVFNIFFYQPLFNGLIFLYNIIPGRDMGFAIIILTVIIRLILWPLTNKSIKNQKIIAKIQPQAEEIRKKFKNNKEEQARALMKLYADNHIHPLAGFIPVIVQIPILIALWRVFLNSMTLDFSSLYSFIVTPERINSLFLGLIDLSGKSAILVILAGVLQYFQMKMIMPGATQNVSGKPDFAAMVSKQMLYLGPVLSIVIFWSLPAALPLYWIVVTLMTLLQQYIYKNGRGEVNTN